MKTTSHKELLRRFMELKGTTIFGFDAETEAKLLKKHRDTKEPCPFNGIVKRISASCILNKNYVNAVNRQTLIDNGVDSSGSEKEINEKLEALGIKPFTPQKRKWGNKIEGTPIIEHKDDYYIECIFREQDGHRISFIGYFDQKGNKIDEKELEGYLPTKNRSNTQSHNENEEYVRSYKMNSMKTIRLKGEELKVV